MPTPVALLSLHSSPLAPPGATDVGGMNVYIRRVAEGLAARGVAVDVFTRRSSPDDPEIVELESGARLIHLTGGPSRPILKREVPLHIPEMTCAMVDFARRERRTYGILYAHYWVSGLVAERFRLNAGGRPPLLQMFHTLALVKRLHSGSDDPSDSALRPDAERRLVRRADVIVGGTQAEAHDIETLYGRPPGAFEVLAPGVDIDLFRPIDRHAARTYLGVSGQRVVLYVGRFHRLKGLDVLLRAVAALPPQIQEGLRLLLVGGDGEHGQSEVRRYRRLALDLKLDRIVDFRGRAPQEELPLYYSAADVCAIPSLHESFGMTALEAMACQVPVVASRAGGLATTIDDGSTGYLALPGNVGSFRDRLTVALTSPDGEAIGRRARVAAQRYTWDSTVSRTLRLFGDVRARQRRPEMAATGSH